MLLFVATAGAADLYLGLGGGVQHTHDWAFQVAAPLGDGVEAHYSYWSDGRRVGALGAGYRWRLLPSVSLVFGGAYVNRVSENLLWHVNAYFEFRWHPLDRLSCQFGHYSSVGDDVGENLLLCGVHWRRGRARTGAGLR